MESNKLVERRSATAMRVNEEPFTSLADYSSISIAFTARELFDVEKGHPPGGFILKARASPPFTKDYDAFEGERPSDWTRQFDVSRWALLSAWEGARRVGGAVVAWDTEGVEMLEGRRDLAVLWDIRVAPEARGIGVGSALLSSAVSWARSRGCHELKVETQNVNVAACRFYARNGFVLKTVNRTAYPRLPNEIQLLWYLDLTGSHWRDAP